MPDFLIDNGWLALLTVLHGVDVFALLTIDISMTLISMPLDALFVHDTDLLALLTLDFFHDIYFLSILIPDVLNDNG